jgi:hypothetical protein
MSYRALEICGEHPKYLQVKLLWWKNWQLQTLLAMKLFSYWRKCGLSFYPCKTWK